MDTQTIKDHMPETYKAITKMAGKIGNEAYRAVRHGLAGQTNKFYAMERGWVVGTPFDLPGVKADMAVHICQFGAKEWLMWSPDVAQLEKQVDEAAKASEAGDGTH